MYKHFFIIGAQRSGTTYLARVLDQHPDISMAKPLIPELKFFLNTSEKSLNYKNYLTNFILKKKIKNLLGEKTTSYFEQSHIAHKIKSIIKDYKIIIILRNPINRAISHYNYSVKSGVENLDFETAIKLEKYRSRNWKKLINQNI